EKMKNSIHCLVPTKFAFKKKSIQKGIYDESVFIKKDDEYYSANLDKDYSGNATYTLRVAKKPFVIPEVKDGSVDMRDLTMFSQHWLAHIPEPVKSKSSETEPNFLPWHFIVTADMRNSYSQFRSVCDAIKVNAGKGDFHIIAGDMCGNSSGETVSDIRNIINSKFGSNYRWIPAIGNHEISSVNDVPWLRAEWNNANGSSSREAISDYAFAGPVGCEETMYYFEHKGFLFVVLNIYWDGTTNANADYRGLTVNGYSGRATPQLVQWLDGVFDLYPQSPKFVIAHAPVFPHNRHLTDSLNAYPSDRNILWQLMEDNNVVAFFCGHTHAYSRYQVNNSWDNTSRVTGDTWSGGDGQVWQIDAGNAGNESGGDNFHTFVSVEVDGSVASLKVWNNNGGSWSLLECIDVGI
ncbi:MAG: metallophosphoesterase family protein, partial [Candidatus Asgardarchaeia archaeon]